MRWLLSLVIAAAWIGAPAAASVGVRAEVEDLAEAADVVADGVVLSHSCSLDGAAGVISTSYRIRVSAALAGAVTGEIVVRVPGGTVGSVSQETIGAPSLDDGARVVLFLGPPENSGARGVIALAQGAFRVDLDPGTGAATCRNSVAGLSLVERDGRTACGGPLELPFAEMVSRVAKGRERAETRRRAAREARERLLARWRRAAELREPALRGRPGGTPVR